MELKHFLKGLFDYNIDLNTELIKIFEREESLIPERSVSFLNHILNAHQVWNQRILGEPILHQIWDIRPFEMLAAINQKNHEQSLHVLEKKNLEALLDYKTMKGVPFSSSIQDILFHIINHSTHHRAQIATDLRAAGLEPIVSDYIFYKRNS